MRLKVLIVDDEPLAREGLRMLLAGDELAAGVTEARSGREAIAAIRQDRPDLVFLDIQMPRIDGFGVIRDVGPGKMPPVIFVTAHDQYAIRAFEINAVDYLLKPVTEARFRLAFQRAAERLSARPRDETVHQMLALLETVAQPRRYLTRLAVRVSERTVFVDVADVDWIQAAENYVQVHAGNVSHLLHVPMNTVESALDPSIFLRIHRSAIVNAAKIRQLWSSTHGQYIVEMTSGVRLQSGRTYNERLKTLASNPF